MCWINQVLKTNWFILHVTSLTECNVTGKLSGTTPLSYSRLKRTLAKPFSNYWTEMFHPIIDYIAVKISYSCMPNMASHISSHNKNIIQEFKKSQYPNPKTWLVSSRGLSPWWKLQATCCCLSRRCNSWRPF